MARKIMMALLSTSTALQLRDDNVTAASLSVARQTENVTIGLDAARLEELQVFAELAKKTDNFKMLTDLAALAGKDGTTFSSSPADSAVTIDKLRDLGRRALEAGNMKTADEIKKLGELITAASQGYPGAAEGLKKINELTEYGNVVRLAENMRKPTQGQQLGWLIKVKALAEAAKRGNTDALKSLAKIAAAQTVVDKTNAEKDKLKKARIKKEKATAEKARIAKAAEAAARPTSSPLMHPDPWNASGAVQAFSTSEAEGLVEGEESVEGEEKPSQGQQLGWLIKVKALANAAKAGNKEALKSLIKVAQAQTVEDKMTADKVKFKKARIAKEKAKKEAAAVAANTTVQAEETTPATPAPEAAEPAVAPAAPQEAPAAQ